MVRGLHISAAYINKIMHYVSYFWIVPECFIVKMSSATKPWQQILQSTQQAELVQRDSTERKAHRRLNSRMVESRRGHKEDEENQVRLNRWEQNRRTYKCREGEDHWRGYR